MKILQVVLSLGMGGQERLVLRMAQGLRERGHDCSVITLSTGGELRREFAAVPVHEVPRRNQFDASLYPKLWRLFRSLRPDVVHTHNPAPLVYAVPAARLAGTRCIVHTKHGAGTIPGRTLRLARVAARLVDHFVAVSTETALSAQQNERPRLRCLSVIENGIPLRAFGPDPVARATLRQELGIPDRALVVGTVGRLVPDKDHVLLVRAMAPLLGPDVRLVIVGEGPSRGDVEAAIDANSRPYVVLTGVRHDVPRLLCAFDVFASSSRTEGLPLALPEAMTSALPVVATAVGGVPGIVPEKAGKLVPHGDVEALRNAIGTLLVDADRRARLGAAGRAYALDRFAEERMLSDYLTRYTCGSPSRRR